MMKELKFAVVAGVALVAGLSTAQAVPTLGINGAVTVVDEGAFDDQVGIPGWVSYSNPVGGMSIVSVDGFSAPAVGTATEPEMDISAALMGTGAPFFVSLADTGFSGTYQVSSHIGGTTAGTLISYQVFVNNALVASLNLGPFPGPSYSDDSFGALVLTPGDEVKMVVTVTHTRSTDLTSYDAWLKFNSVPDSGSTLVLLGAGMLAFRWIPRRRMPLA